MSSLLHTPFEMEKDEAGKFKRLWIERKLTNPHALAPLQQRLAAHIPDFTPLPPDILHMTLLHVGIPEELYSEVNQEVPHLSFESFMVHIQGLLGSCRANMHANILPVQNEQLDTFGLPEQRAVVLKIKKSRAITDDRASLVKAVKNFLKLCGIINVSAFMLNSKSLQYELPARHAPHITLGYTSEKSLDLFEISSIDISLAAPTVGR